MRWSELDAEACSLARATAIIGDRWSLLLLRECFTGVRRFEEFQGRLGISRSILTDRLQKLCEAFVLTRVAYQQDPVRFEYRLTPKGRALYPVIMAIVHWGDEFLAGKKGRPLVHVHDRCLSEFDPVMVCSECGEPVDPRGVHIYPGPGAPKPHNIPHLPETVLGPPEGIKKRRKVAGAVSSHE